MTSARLKLPSSSSRVIGCLLATSFLLGTAASPQEPVAIEVAAFFPETEGDSWLFAPPRESEERRTLHATEVTPRGGLRIDGSDGSLRVQQTSTRLGWLVFEEAALGGRRLTYEEPLQLLPSRIETGSTHESEGRYVLVRDEGAVGAGTVRATVVVGPLQTVETPAGTFADCLAVELTLELTDDEQTDAPITWTRRLWRARGVGLVREISGPPPLDLLLPNETETGDEETEWALVEAAVGGTLVTTAEDPRPDIDLGTFEPPPR